MARMDPWVTKAVKVKLLSLSSLSLDSSDPKEYSSPPLASNGHISSSKPRPNFALLFFWVSRMCGREVWSYGRWYGSPVRTTLLIYAQYSSFFFWWSTHLLLVAHVRTRPYTHPIFAPWTIFSQTLPSPSSDQSKSFLDLSPQDNYFRTLLKLDWTLLDIF